MKTVKDITIDVRVGTELKFAITDAIEIADIIKLPVTLSFNGAVIKILPTKTVEDYIEDYHKLF